MSDSTVLSDTIFLIYFSTRISTQRHKHTSLNETGLYFSGFSGFVSVLQHWQWSKSELFCPIWSLLIPLPHFEFQTLLNSLSDWRNKFLIFLSHCHLFLQSFLCNFVPSVGFLSIFIITFLWFHNTSYLRYYDISGKVRVSGRNKLILKN